MEDRKFAFKVLLDGCSNVGKTCLMERFAQGPLTPVGEPHATIGVEFRWETVQVDGEKVKLQIWATAGPERFRTIVQSYYRSAHAIILVYDITSQDTFDCLPDRLQDIEKYADKKVLRIRILVGNKTDSEDKRVIPRNIGEDFAKKHNMHFFETSAKTAENVERLFMEIAVELVEQAKCKKLPENDHGQFSTLGKTKSVGNRPCCML